MIKIDICVCFWDTFTIQPFTLRPKLPFVFFVGPRLPQSQLFVCLFVFKTQGNSKYSAFNRLYCSVRNNIYDDTYRCFCCEHKETRTICS